MVEIFVENILFFIFAFAAIVSAVLVITLKNPVHCALFLMSTLLQVAAIFLLLRSPFLAAVQVFIYVGAVMVLFLFVVMLLDVRKTMVEIFRPKHRPWALLVAAILLIESLVVIFRGGLDVMNLATAGAEVKVETIGRALFTTYIFPFELVSVLLLVAMVGAIVMVIEKRSS